MTGGTGFVGSNVMHVALARGHEVLTTVHNFAPPSGAAYATERVDVTLAGKVAASVARFRPDVVVHCAILNDWQRMYDDRRHAWASYVDATRHTADAAAEAGAAYVLVSTDWVFDGTQHGADEATPPNPINFYGVLKVASELVTVERGGAVARVSGVNGLHRVRPDTPRTQDPGFGYFVASLVDALRSGDRFTVWIGDDINMVATPSLATESAEMILDIGAQRLAGIFHACGGESIGRWDLAQLTCDVFGLDSTQLDTGPPDPQAMPGAPIPYDTSLTSPRTSSLLARSPTPVRSLLERFREEYEAAA